MTSLTSVAWPAGRRQDRARRRRRTDVRSNRPQGRSDPEHLVLSVTHSLCGPWHALAYAADPVGSLTTQDRSEVRANRPQSRRDTEHLLSVTKCLCGPGKDARAHSRYQSQRAERSTALRRLREWDHSRAPGDESPYFSRRQPANPAGHRRDSAPNSQLILFAFIHPDKRENVPSSARQASPPEVCSLVRATAASRSSPSKGLRSTSVTPVSPAVSRRAVTTSTGTFASVADPAR